MSRLQNELQFLKNDQNFFKLLNEEGNNIINFVSIGFLFYFFKRNFLTHENIFKEKLNILFSRFKHSLYIGKGSEPYSFFVNEIDYFQINTNFHINIEDRIIFYIYTYNLKGLNKILLSNEKTFTDYEIFKRLVLFNYNTIIEELLEEKLLSSEQVLYYLKSNTTNKKFDMETIIENYCNDDVLEYIINNMFLNDDLKEMIEYEKEEIFEVIEEYFLEKRKNKKQKIDF